MEQQKSISEELNLHPESIGRLAKKLRREYGNSTITRAEGEAINTAMLAEIKESRGLFSRFLGLCLIVLGVACIGALFVNENYSSPFVSVIVTLMGFLSLTMGFTMVRGIPLKEKPSIAFDAIQGVRNKSAVSWADNEV